MEARDPTSQPPIVVRDLSKSFGSRHVLRDVNASFGRGEISVIIGGSGTGKTTLLRLLIGLEKPTKGSVIIDGEDTAPLNESEMNRVRRKFGMVFQYAALLDSLTIMDNVAFPLREHTKLSEREVKERVLARLRDLGLDENVADQFPSQLSGGMRKRVGLARALMLDPKIIVYDEPTSGLDPFTTELVDEMIVSTRDRLGVTSIVISHDMASALRIADQIHVLSEGRIVESGSPDQLASGQSPAAQRFIQASGVDVADARRRRAGGSGRPPAR